MSGNQTNGQLQTIVRSLLGAIKGAATGGRWRRLSHRGYRRRSCTARAAASYGAGAGA